MTFFFFSLSLSCIKLFTLKPKLCHFFTFLTVWVFQERFGKVNLDWLKVFFLIFLSNFDFFIRSSSWFFYLDFISRVLNSSSYLELIWILFFSIVFFEFSSLLLVLEIYYYFLFLYLKILFDLISHTAF
jgi:hypothetical protein